VFRPPVGLTFETKKAHPPGWEDAPCGAGGAGGAVRLPLFIQRRGGAL